jgi:4-amino-4-deoxy-L-arabinose transferase-like glycosyltransferase
VPTAAACGLAVLTKGPVGVALPGLVILLYLAWNRELGRLLDRKLVTAAVVFLLVAGPWYALVTADTRGEWARQFFARENVRRFSTPMEGHRGSVFYHAAALFVLFAPWSVFLGAAVWYGVRATRSPRPTPAPPDAAGSGPEIAAPPDAAGSPRPYRFLICWLAVYLAFFSAAATKLPNYMLPVYPALAILTARFLTRWRAGELAPPNWVMRAALTGLVVTAGAVGGGLVVAGGAVPVLPAGSRVFPGLEVWAALGVVPLAAAVVMARAARANDRGRFVRAMAVGSVALTALLAAFPPLAVDARKAPRELVRASGVDDPGRDLRLAHLDWFQPSVVFYARREVVELSSPDVAAAFLAEPTPGYLFVPERTWVELVAAKVPVPTQVVARRHDFLRNCDVLVVTNDTTAAAGR